MDFEEYRLRGKDMVDYIANYLKGIRSRRVFPNVSPGYMRTLVPETAPEVGEEWDEIFRDVERVIMPGVQFPIGRTKAYIGPVMNFLPPLDIGVKMAGNFGSCECYRLGITHWQSPHMHAYFPALNSFPSLLGDMLADAIGCLGFTWASSPACTELETIVMDWLGKMIGLPSVFLHSNEQTMGGGVIQTTASDATFVSILAARSEAIRLYKGIHPDLDDAEINARLVGYCSDQAHSSVEKAGLISLVKMRFLPSDERLSLRGETLLAAVEKDRADGFIPFFLCGTLGTTGACAFDNLRELGPICESEGLWMHIDAAYAGTAFVCPEFRKFLEGVEYAQSFAFNPSKWMMVHFDCTAMWVKNSGALHRTFNVDPLYLKHDNTGAAIDYMHWQVPLSRRFRAIKLWFVIRSFGVKGLQKHVREGIRLAKKFEDMVRRDARFEIPAERIMGMVVFRLKGENEWTEILLKKLNSSGKLHMVPASLKGKYVIRFTVTSQYTKETDIERDWKIIKDTATRVLAEDEDEVFEDIKETENELKVMRREPSLKRKDYGMSLILSNVPMSPKFINGSFAAIFDNNDVIYEFAKQLTASDLNGRPIRLSPRRRIKLRDSSKQQSLDFNMIATRRDPRTFKQGSLDSKIEEIFECSVESDGSSGLAQGEENDGEDYDHKAIRSSNTTVTVRVPQHGSSRQPPRVQVIEKNGDSAAVLVTGKRHDTRKEISPTSDDRGVSRNGGKYNGVRFVCKFCGHAVDE